MITFAPKSNECAFCNVFHNSTSFPRLYHLSVDRYIKRLRVMSCTCSMDREQLSIRSNNRFEGSGCDDTTIVKYDQL